MKGFFTYFLLIFSLTILQGQDVFLNEINYISANPADRWVEVAGDAGTDLDGWYMTFHEANGTIYHTETITGFTPIDDEGQSKGGIWIPIIGLQDQGDKSIILYDDMGVPKDTVSYGTIGNFTLLGVTLAIPITTLVGAQTLVTHTAQNQGFTNFSSWLLQPATKGFLNQTQLPVDLVGFRATMREKAVALTWETASEENNSHFEIQRSRDGLDFSSIGTLIGAGTSFEAQSYEFMDYYPMNGTNYYRLKQVDFYNDGYELSDIVLVESQSDFVLTIAPNPVRKGDDFRLITNEDVEIRLVLYDLTGKVLRTYMNIANQKIELSDLSAGTYIYQLRKGKEMIKVDKLVILQD